MTLRFSLVIPLHNEAGNILPLLEHTIPVLTSLTGGYEILLVDDGSTDGTSAEIASSVTRWPQCRELRLPCNEGQAVALFTGLRAARGDLLLTMDGDGQNDPVDFPALLALVESGRCDLACGWRMRRRDPLLRRVMSRVANSVRRIVLRDGIHDAGCQLRVMRRAVLAAFEPMELLQSFMPALAVAAGFRVAELPVLQHARQHGESKYSLAGLWWRPAVAMLALRWRLSKGRAS